MKDSSKTKQGMIAEESVLKQRSPDFEQLESSYKLTGMELQNNEELFRSYLEYVPEGVYINDLEGNFLYGNRKSEEIIGYQLDELIGKNFLELNILTEDSLSKAAQLLQANIEGKSTGPDEIELINKEGHIVPVEINTNVVQRMGQKIVLGFVRDITERKQAEKALRESEENFHRSLDDSPLGVRIVTIEGETIYANRAILDIYGYDSVEELRKTPTKNRYTPQSYAEFKIRMEKRKRGNEGPSEYEISIVRKNGEIHHLQVFRKEVLWDGERQFQTIYQDITERKRDEEALRESQQQLSNIIEFLPDATMVIDKDEKVIAWNRSIEEMTGIKKEDMLGKGNKEYSIPFYGDRRPILIDLALHPDKEMEKQYTAIQRVADILFGEAYTPNLPHGKIHLSDSLCFTRLQGRNHCRYRVCP
jgi:PAS domain S-box-containing protein